MSLQKLASLFKTAEKSFDEFEVKYFAKKASDQYLNKTASLNQAIKKIAYEENFNDDQVRRICESANHIVNQHLFDTQDDKNVYFEIADAQAISGTDKIASVYSDYDYDISFHKEAMVKEALSPELRFNTAIEQSARRAAADQAFGGAANSMQNAGTLPSSLKSSRPLWPESARYSDAHLYDIGAPASKVNQVSNFADAVAARKGQLIKGLNTAGLKKHFTNIGSNLLSKLASEENYGEYDWEISAIDPRLTLMKIQEKIAAVNELAREKHEANTYKIKEAQWKLFNLAKKEVQEDPFYKVAQAIAMTTDKHEILEGLTEDLLEARIISEEDVYAVVKTAGELDKEHPIVKWTNKYASLLTEQALLKAAEKETASQLKILAQELK